MGKMNPKRLGRIVRHKRVRRRIHGAAGRPRLVVFRSARHIYAQIVDDTTGRTMVSVGSIERAFKETGSSGRNVEGAAALGKLLVERARAKGVGAVVFDRNGYLYHGRVKALADAAREGGLVF